MLEDINIKDFILIDNVSLEFGRGFNVLTGETGAGKSILIGALTFLLGGKSSADQIRTGCKEAVVSGTVLIPAGNKAALNWLEERGVVPEENRVLLRRILKDNGRSLAWINELAVTRNELDEFTSYLFDIHGQHEHQNLLKAASHGPYLDLYCGISSKVEEFSSLYYRLSEKKKQLGELQLSEREKKEKLEYLEFAVSEIEEAKLTEGEEEILEQEESKLVNFEKLYGVLEQVNTLLGDESGIISLLKKNKNLLETAVPLDSTLESFLSRSENSFYEVQDIYEGLRQYQESLSFEPGRLEQVQERLSLIFKLKKKYAGSSDLSVKGILAFRDSALEEMKDLTMTEENRQVLQEEIKELEKSIYKLGTFLHDKREEASGPFSEAVTAIINSLGMKNAVFSVSLSSRPGTETTRTCTPTGFDSVEFLISSNEGEPSKPLSKIASGGEISRVMLAIKSVLAGKDSVDTLVFDEIDTGIGGEVALEVGSHISSLSEFKQILCITHLASIAVRADNHIRIEKKTESGNTRTSAVTLGGEERVKEIARMLSGDAYDEAALVHSREMMEKYGKGAS